MVPDRNERVKIDMQMDDFKNARGLFDYETAIDTRTKKTPAEWWDSFGAQCPELSRLATRILSLTCSSSGCERNWSAFEMVHTKRRNRLHQDKLNDLVYVMHKLKLKHKQQQKTSKNQQSYNFNLEDIPSDDEWITEGASEDPTPPTNEEWIPIIGKALCTEDEDTYSCRGDNVESGTHESTHGSGIGGGHGVATKTCNEDEAIEINDGDDVDVGDDFLERMLKLFMMTFQTRDGRHECLVTSTLVVQCSSHTRNNHVMGGFIFFVILVS